MRDAPYVDNEISGTVTGGVVLAHTITGGVRVGDGRPVARSAYLEQVRRIAPKQLEDRDAELAELASFCTALEAGPYVWWRAAAWAGKSALLSWFVLHPPAGRAGGVVFHHGPFRWPK